MVFRSYRSYGRRSFRRYPKRYKKSYVSKAVKSYVSRAIVAKKEFLKLADNTNPTVFSTPAFEYFVELSTNHPAYASQAFRLVSIGGVLQFNNDTANACLFRVVILKTYDSDSAFNSYDDIFEASVTTRLVDGIQVQDDLTNQFKVVYDKYISLPATNIDRSFGVKRYKIRCNDKFSATSYGGYQNNPRYIMCVGTNASSANVKLVQWRCVQEI